MRPSSMRLSAYALVLAACLLAAPALGQDSDCESSAPQFLAPHVLIILT
jgi:hypothetical protein